MTPPLIVLGVSRSGTTMLRVMLDRSSGLAIPDESFLIPLLARRHRRVDAARFLDDVGRISKIAAWGLGSSDVAPRLRPGMSTGGAIAAILEAYAAKQASRAGGTRTWPHPETVAQFSCAWATEVDAALALGRRVGAERYLEIRYERLVADPEEVVASICSFAGLPFERRMIEYAGEVDASDKPHQRRLEQAPTAGVRDWRDDMAEGDVRAFEEVAGDVLRRLRYETPAPRPGRRTAGAWARLGSYRARLLAWNAAVSAVQRSPLWQRRHPTLR